MKKYEYNTIQIQLRVQPFSGKIDFNALDSELNQLGLDGWELISMTASPLGNYYMVCVFRKEIG